MLEWAMRRAHKDKEQVNKTVPVIKWLEGQAQPTYKQLEKFAQTTYTAVGTLLLPEPPEEPLPIADWRVKTDVEQPSANLLDTLFMMQERQDWYISNALGDNPQPLPFIGKATVDTNPRTAAYSIQETLGIPLEERVQAKDWEDAFRTMVERVRGAGILVMTNGVVGSNTQRPLDPREFRGFTLMDVRAPLIFINNKDAKSAQMFTLAHELAHIWLGEGGLDDLRPVGAVGSALERWCNSVAAEVLVPSLDLATMVSNEPLEIQAASLSRRYKVSRAVVLRSMEGVAGVDEADRRRLLLAEYSQTVDTSGGGNFYATAKSRTGEAFAATVISSALEGRTTFREAYDLLGIGRSETFQKLAREVGVLE